MSSTAARLMYLAAIFAVAAVPSAVGRAQSGARERWQTLATQPYQKKRDDVIFIDKQTAFYGTGAGQLFRTDDGGQHWSLSWDRPGTFIRAVNFIDADRGFVGNLGAGLAGTTDRVPLYRTMDGGKTWRPAGLSEADIAGVCAIDILKTRAIVGGRIVARIIVSVAGRANGPARFARSDDGGEHWRTADLGDRAAMILDVKFLDPNVGYLFAGTDADPTRSRALVLRTGDGGISWREVYRSDRIGEIIWKASFPTARIGYATVQNEAPGRARQSVLKTSDGGRHWRKLELTVNAKATEFGIGFTSATRGWVGTAVGGFSTADGGRTWQPANLAPFANKIRTSTANGGRLVYAIGTELQVLR